MPNRFASGKRAISECDRCGQRYKLKRLKQLVIKTKNVNILVCPECWEQDHPQLQLGMYPVDDPQALRNPRPDTSYAQSGLGVDGFPGQGSRDIQWGWNPVGLNNPLGLSGLTDSLSAYSGLGVVSVEITPTPPVTLRSFVSQYGVTFFFSEPRLSGRYANGDWWVLGPVELTAITPASTLHNGVNGAGTPYTNRVVHGTMVNPGNRSFAVGGLAANNTTNTVQGWDSINSSIGFVAYSAPANVDPGMTGASLGVTSGSVVKFVSRLTGLPNGAQNRPAGLDMVVLTVVENIPALDAIRPGVSRAGGKASPARLSQFNLDVFQNLLPTPSAPTFAQALDWIDRYHETSLPDSINNPTAKGINNHPEYGRDIGNNLHRAMLCLHLSTFTPEQKLTLLSHLSAIADDLVSRMEEGAIVLGGGGGNQWKKPVVALCAAALGVNAPASWLTYLSDTEKFRWGEDSQNFAVRPFDVALARFTADGRPRAPYTHQMLGSIEWGEGQSYQPERSGSNWDSFYRDIVNYSLYPGLLAVELTTGGKASYGHADLWTYYDTVYLRRTEGSPGNTLLPFPLEMTNAYRPTKTAAPVVVDAGIRDTAIWLRFDLALNELVAAPATSAFTVNVNGTPVVVSSVSIWRQNIGLTLATPVAGNDVVTVNYATPGVNPVRSVDGVAVAGFAGQALINRTEKVGGPNAAFPVVQFTPGVSRAIVTNTTLGAANTSFGTLALLKFRFEAPPAANFEIFGNREGVATMRIFLNVNNTLEVQIHNAAGGQLIRLGTPALTAGVDNDILFSLDMTQATSGAGINCYVNGVLQALNVVTWGGGIGVTAGWARNWPVLVNPGVGTSFRLGALWLDTNTRVDLTNAANRAKFTSATAGNLDILTLGNGITGSQPSQFLVGSADQWNSSFGLNRGTGGRFFPTTGLVTPVSGSEWV